MSSLEARILALVRERDLATRDDLRVMTPDPAHRARWGARVAFLIQIGVLDEAAVRDLEMEIDAADSSLADTIESSSSIRRYQEHSSSGGDEPSASTWESSGQPCTPLSSDLEPGAQLGPYRFLRTLGSGGMGVVHLVQDERLGRKVALKVLRRSGASMAKRFTNEAKLHARVSHTNVCKVYEAGSLGTHPFIAMQYIDGATLLEAGRAMSLQHKVSVMRDIARAAHAIHLHGLVHRDIKPTNVLVRHSVTGAWRPYLLDFGIARDALAPNETMTGEIVGSPSYMAPEQAVAARSPIDARADVYGLGATLHALISGRPPFGTRYLADLLVSSEETDPDPLSDPDRYVPRDVEIIVRKCLRRSPHQRYRSAKDLADDLQRYLDGVPIKARAPSVLYRLTRFVRHHRRLSALTAVAVVVLTLLVGILVRERALSSAASKTAQLLGHEAETTEAMTARIYMVPVHSTSQEWDDVRNHMQRLESYRKHPDRRIEGVLFYTLGLGYQSLGELKNANTAFHLAFVEGFHDRRRDLRHAEVLGALYRDSITVSHWLPDTQWRAIHADIADHRFRAPANELLQNTRLVDPVLEESTIGLFAFLNEDYHGAVLHCRRHSESAPWDQEAPLLEGDALLASAFDAHSVGRIPSAYADALAAIGAFEKAIEVAPSDPRGYYGAIDAGLALLRWNLCEQDRHRIIALCEQFISQLEIIEPNPGRVDAVRGQLLLVTALGEPGDPGLLHLQLQDARDLGERAALEAPSYERVHWQQSLVCSVLGDLERELDLDPSSSFECASLAAEHAWLLVLGLPRAVLHDPALQDPDGWGHGTSINRDHAQLGL